MSWLARNKASPELWMSLVAKGNGLQLEQMIHDFHRPISYHRMATALSRRVPC
jgi:hypothetical protein